MGIKFELDDAQEKKLEEWMSARPPVNEGAIGGRFVYSFVETSIGMVTKVRDDVLGDEIDLTDYESW